MVPLAEVRTPDFGLALSRPSRFCSANVSSEHAGLTNADASAAPVMTPNSRREIDRGVSVTRHIPCAMLKTVSLTPALFEPDLPDGFVYRDGFISIDEEAGLTVEIRALEFSNFEMRGAIARRRVAFFGLSYTAGRTTPPIPGFLMPLRSRVAAWAGVLSGDFAMVLINEYSPGAPIGWHRDAPQYELIAGVSILSPARMRLRPYVSPSQLAGGPRRSPRKATHELMLQPRSAYVMRGTARNRYEHSIPPVTALRYSITFRTLRP